MVGGLDRYNFIIMSHQTNRSCLKHYCDVCNPEVKCELVCEEHHFNGMGIVTNEMMQECPSLKILQVL